MRISAIKEASEHYVSMQNEELRSLFLCEADAGLFVRNGDDFLVFAKGFLETTKHLKAIRGRFWAITCLMACYATPEEWGGVADLFHKSIPTGKAAEPYYSEAVRAIGFREAAKGACLSVEGKESFCIRVAFDMRLGWQARESSERFYLRRHRLSASTPYKRSAAKREGRFAITRAIVWRARQP